MDKPRNLCEATPTMGVWAQSLLMAEVVAVGRRLVYGLLDLAALDLDPVAVGMPVVISGHSHRPDSIQKAGCFI